MYVCIISFHSPESLWYGRRGRWAHYPTDFFFFVSGRRAKKKTYKKRSDCPPSRNPEKKSTTSERGRRKIKTSHPWARQTGTSGVEESKGREKLGEEGKITGEVRGGRERREEGEEEDEGEGESKSERSGSRPKYKEELVVRGKE